MIITETIKLNNKEFIHNYSNEGYYIQKTGTDEIYADAMDLPEMGFTYEETDKKIEEDNNELIR